jgi:hypothetical protein
MVTEKEKGGKMSEDEKSEVQETETKEVKRDEDGHIIVAENVKLVFSGDISFLQD